MSWKLRQKARNRRQREEGTIFARRVAPVRGALVYPNTYRLGMSNLGFQTLYRLLNELPDSACERAFLPDPEELREYRRTRTPLATLETQTPLRELDWLGFSVHFELDYVHLLDILDLARIGWTREERSEEEPLIIAGGPCVTCNPEPLADFVDAFVIGEGEEVVGEIVAALAHPEAVDHPRRRRKLERLAAVEGVYVPVLHRPTGTEATVIRKRWVRDLSQQEAYSAILTPDTEFGDKYLIEVTRGCGRGCRFCLAGYAFRPPRERPVEEIMNRVREGLRQRNGIGLVGAAVTEHPEIEEICTGVGALNGLIALSSLRAENLTERLLQTVYDSGQRTLTLAPEVGTERQRRVLNKDLTDVELLNVIRLAGRIGFKQVRLYFMIGTPGETEEDVRAIPALAQQALEAGALQRLTLSVSAFVPKAFTPFQWSPMDPVERLEEKLAWIRAALPRGGRMEIHADSPQWALWQGLLARGGRELGPVLRQVAQEGNTLGAWRRAVRAAGLDLAQRLHQPWDWEKPLPWDHLDLGVAKRYLWKEYRKATQGLLTRACQVGTCFACGACDGNEGVTRWGGDKVTVGGREESASAGT